MITIQGIVILDNGSILQTSRTRGLPSDRILDVKQLFSEKYKTVKTHEFSVVTGAVRQLLDVRVPPTRTRAKHYCLECKND